MNSDLPLKLAGGLRSSGGRHMLDSVNHHLYDHIGQSYNALRRPDPRIAQRIVRALGEAHCVANIGAGAGSYEPRDREVIAVEPSMTMIRQRPIGRRLAVQAVAEHLPFKDASVDATLAILTIHHWQDWHRGLEEVGRICRGPIVILTWDPAAWRFWLTDEYLPQLIDWDRQDFPSLEMLRRALGKLSVEVVPIPADCSDGFLGAYWQRPQSYLDPNVRSAISSFSKITDVAPGIERLRLDLQSGAWHRKHGHLLERSSLDIGYRLVTVGGR
jgi:SAM-dependent methyltransferase